MDSSSSLRSSLPKDCRIDSAIAEFSDKLSLGTRNPACHRSGAVKSDGGDASFAADRDGSDTSLAADHGDADQKGVISVNSYHPPESSEGEDGQLWPRVSDLEDCPPSPTPLQGIAIKEVISESSYHSPTVGAHVSGDAAEVDDGSKQKISKCESEEQNDNSTSSPDFLKRVSAGSVDNQQAFQEVMPGSLSAHPSRQRSGRPPLPGARGGPAASPETHTSMRESHRSSARGGAKLSRVMEESESFARREFGASELIYMSTHGSADHATNVSALQALQEERRLEEKQVSYKHNNYHQFNYNLRISQEPSKGGLASSKSAPAGTATRTGSAFGLFRRGGSEHSALRMNKRTIFRPRRPRRPKTLASTLLWPLIKIKDRYVNFMMRLEGTGDLRGMAQGGTYGDCAGYFADIPLSKNDSTNHG